MEDFEWQNDDVQLKFRLLEKTFNKFIKDRFEFIIGVELDPVSFQKNYGSMAYNKQYKMKVFFDKSMIQNFDEDKMDNVEGQFYELFDTILKSVAPPLNKKNYFVSVDVEPKLV
jgi:hypothetical protein